MRMKTFGFFIAEIGGKIIHLGLRIAGQRCESVTIFGEDGQRVSGPPDTVPAERLAAIWNERERIYRGAAAEYRDIGNAVEMRIWELRAEAVKRCRLDLQWQFALVRRVGPGPMTEAESEEYLAQEMKAHRGREEQL